MQENDSTLYTPSSQASSQAPVSQSSAHGADELASPPESLGPLPESLTPESAPPDEAVDESDEAPKKSSKKRIFFIVLLLLIIGGGIYLKSRSGGQGEGQGAGQEGPGGAGGGRGGGRNRAVPVNTAKVTLTDLPITVSAIGNVEALETVSIQPQISGRLWHVHFTQGAYVKQGQLLFEIDPRIQQATVAQGISTAARSRSAINQAKANIVRSGTQISVAEANLKRDQAQMAFAAKEVSRNKTLLDKGYIALEQFEQTQNTLTTAETAVSADQAAVINARAQVEADRAALQTAIQAANADQAALEASRVQLSFTKIYSPISGKTGPLLINAGNNVQANTSTLVNIKRLSPIAVTFTVPEKQLHDFQASMQRGRVPVTATLQGDKPYSQTGQLIFIDNMVNKSNGTVQLKASFDNPAGRLWPGQFVNISAEIGHQTKVMSVPAIAVQKGPDGDYVFVVKDKKAQMQPVTVDRIINGLAVISKGLSAGQIVVTEGQLNLSPGSAVDMSDGKGKNGPGGQGGKSGAGKQGGNPSESGSQDTGGKQSDDGSDGKSGASDSAPAAGRNNNNRSSDNGGRTGNAAEGSAAGGRRRGNGGAADQSSGQNGGQAGQQPHQAEGAMALPGSEASPASGPVHQLKVGPGW